MLFVKSLTYQNTYYLFRDNGQEITVKLMEYGTEHITSDIKLTSQETAFIKCNICKKEIQLESI